MPRERGFRGDSPAVGDGRADGLWRETCCEAFLRVGDEPGYLEFNFSPSGEWAAYEFSAYRAGMRELAMRAPRIAVQRDPRAAASEDPTLVAGFGLQATIELPGRLRSDPALAGRLQLALTAVLRLGRTGLTTHWSLCHPPGKPDFHAPANFALALPALPTASG
jgi:hypothetical protein